MPAAIIGVGTAVPQSRSQQELWDNFFSRHHAGDALAEKIWQRSGVDTRSGVVDPLIEDVSQWGTGARMRRFIDEALPLGKLALERALDDSGLAPDDIGLLTVVSCTGYATPGLDIMLASELGLPTSVQRLHIGHMGCYAAIPGIGAVADATAARGLASLLLCVELPSLHVQHATDEIEQVVAHALFADAAAALVLVPGTEPAGLEVVDLIARTDVSTSAMMTWDITDHGFRMGLSPLVPKVLGMHVASVVKELLDKHGLTPADVGSWVVHPGGPRIVEVVAQELGLEDSQMDHSREILRTQGNCSSATVLLILESMMADKQIGPGTYSVMLAFGPGLTLYGALLRDRRQ